jgi:8-oxo-dGTP pyrophosphatase MutT (NUDIX family)
VNPRCRSEDPPDLDVIRRALAGTGACDARPEGKQAAVAVILAGQATDLNVCLIRRAEHARDRWSGHMALPGGRVDAADATVRAAAIRETWEEVGFRLERALCLGSLETQPVSSAGKPTGISLHPFVFHLGETLEPPTPSVEVAEMFWVPLRHLLDPRNAAYRRTLRDGVTVESPAVLYHGHYIWGLTYRVLTRFFQRLERDIARPE